MVHYFNNTYGKQTPEIFIANLHKYLVVKGIVKDLTEFYNIVKDVEIKDSGFEIKIREQMHTFKWYSGGINILENCPDNCYIISEYQHEWILLPEEEKRGNPYPLL